jgi:hypothetical protein
MKEINSIVTTLKNMPVVCIKNGGNIDIKLSNMTIQRKEDKGMQYLGMDIASNNVMAMVKALGEDIVADKLNTSINTQMKMFNENALIKCKTDEPKWNELTSEKQTELFTAKLVSLVNGWSMREESKASLLKKLQEEMASLGKELSNKDTSVERKTEIMTKLLPELAMKQMSVE